MVYKGQTLSYLVYKEGTCKVGYLISDLITWYILYMWVNRQDNEDNATQAFFYRAAIVHGTMSFWIISVRTCASVSIQSHLIPNERRHQSTRITQLWSLCWCPSCMHISLQICLRYLWTPNTLPGFPFAAPSIFHFIHGVGGLCQITSIIFGAGLGRHWSLKNLKT